MPCMHYSLGNRHIKKAMEIMNALNRIEKTENEKGNDVLNRKEIIDTRSK